MSSNERVSVTIVTFNSGRFIKRCLESVLAQKYPYTEIIVIDNASNDGTNWSGTIGELTGGLCVIYDIGFLGNDIYVAGVFSRAGGVSSPGLAKWNGNDWSSVGFAGVALALVSDGTNLFVGGSFTNAGGVLNTNIARFDGTNWSALGGGLGFYSGGVSPAVRPMLTTGSW